MEKYALCGFKGGAAALQKERKCVKFFPSLALQLTCLDGSFWHPHERYQPPAPVNLPMIKGQQKRMFNPFFFLTQLTL